MPESRKDAEDRAEKEGIPKSNVYCLEEDNKCYIAPQGITDIAAKKAYAEARDKGDDQETAAKIAWTVQNNIDETRSRIDGTWEVQKRNFKDCKLETRMQDATETQPKEFHIRFMPIVTNRKTNIVEEYPRNSGKYRSYTEIISDEFLQKQDFSQVRVLIDHDDKQYLTRGNTNCKFEKTDLGLYADIKCLNTQRHRDAYEEARCGEFNSGSFGFYTSDEIDPKTNIRTVKNGKIYEVSLLRDNPAYEETAAIAVERQEVKIGSENDSMSARQGNDPVDPNVDYINKKLKEILG